MKLFIAFVLASLSMSSFAGPCPTIDGIFACTGIDKNDSGRILKVQTKINDKGLSQLIFNGGVLLTEGSEGIFCHNYSYKGPGRELTLIDHDTFSQGIQILQSGTTTKSYSSTCVRLR